jgi:PAS domain-containing protein
VPEQQPLEGIDAKRASLIGSNAGSARERLLGQHDVEMILMRQLASHLSLPMFIVDSQGALHFYNEPAERLLGRAYEENDVLPIEEWSVAFTPTSEDGRPISAEELPLVVAFTQRRPAFLSPILLTSGDKVQRRVASVAFPIVGQQDRHLGAVAVIWEV